MSFTTNTIFAITDSTVVSQVAQWVVALSVLHKSKCFLYNVTLQRSRWATLLLATKLFFSFIRKEPVKRLFKTDQVENLSFSRVSINMHRQQNFVW